MFQPTDLAMTSPSARAPPRRDRHVLRGVDQLRRAGVEAVSGKYLLRGAGRDAGKARLAVGNA
ncbi:hypothetical protein U6V22_12010, partial [Cutibacterium acnes]